MNHSLGVETIITNKSCKTFTQVKKYNNKSKRKQ